MFEILLPAGLLVALLGLKSAVQDRKINVSYPATYWKNYDNFNQMYSFVPCNSENLVWRCAQSDSCTDESPFNGTDCQRRRIAVAPYRASDSSAATAAADFILWANDKYPIADTYDTFQLFASENDFINLIEKTSYSQTDSIPIYSSAVIFDAGYPYWQYQVRINQTYVSDGSENSSPRTAGSSLDLSVKSNDGVGSEYSSPYNQAYLDTGIFQLMDVVNSYVATKTCQVKGTCTPTETVNVATDGTADFPNPKVSISNFWAFAAFSLALIMIIAVLYPLANVISVLVKEKEGKLREGMLMMSLREDAYWAAWAFNFLVLFLILSIILTIIGSGLFEYSDPIYIFIYFFVFFMGSVAYCFFISTLFNKSRTATIVGVLLFFAGYFIYVGVSLGSTTQPSRSSLLAACLHPACAFVYATLAFAEWEDTNVGITSNTWNDSNLYNITFQDTINMVS
jgi:ATP-binding cassette, subfamily A (ABC1), member 3